MRFSRPDADVFVPSGGSAETALARVTHLCIAAHQDDIEIMAHDGICDCLDAPEHKAFCGVVVTDGAGAPRSGPFSSFTDEQMRAVRREEQRRAAELGGYALQVQLAYPSAEVKRPTGSGLAADLDRILGACSPALVYLHQPADKHDTHVAVFLRSLEALRRLPAGRRPARVLGVEVWRDLDWLADDAKVPLDSGRRPELARRLLAAFDSQISGGKRYDLAAMGRRLANATFHTSHETDRLDGITWAMDLNPLVRDPSLDPTAFTLAHVDRLRQDIADRIRRFNV